MILNTCIPATLYVHYRKELEQSNFYLNQRDFEGAWHHLERAHVLGQAYPLAHTKVHWLMLIFGFKTKNTKEVLGQLPRLFIGGVKSFVGIIPIGNTGGANVPPLRALPIKPELLQIFKASDVQPNNKEQ